MAHKKKNEWVKKTKALMANYRAMKAYVGGQAAIHNRLIRFQRILERRKLGSSSAAAMRVFQYRQSSTRA